MGGMIYPGTVHAITNDDDPLDRELGTSDAELACHTLGDMLELFAGALS